MVGGAGDDTYIVDNAKDSVIETSKKDVDTVQASVSFDLEKFKFIENIVLTGKADIDATGNAGATTRSKAMAATTCSTAASARPDDRR